MLSHFAFFCVTWENRNIHLESLQCCFSGFFLPFLFLSFSSSISFSFFFFSLALVSWIQPELLSLTSSWTIISETYLVYQAEADFEPYNEKHPSHLIIYFLCSNFSVLTKYYFQWKSNILAFFKRSFSLFPRVCMHKIVFLSVSLSETLHVEIQVSEPLECQSTATALVVCINKVRFATKYCFCIPTGITSPEFRNFNHIFWK